jgi:hypothetical protein
MSGKKSNPPSLAIWWLRHACPGSNNDALTGDLIERFREGQTRGWFWRQVLIATIVGAPGDIRRHWPHFSYAIAGAVMIWFFSDAHAFRNVAGLAHWSDLPWPWSQLAFELSRPALLAWAALSVLAAGLVIERSFRWTSLLRTGVITFALITLGHYSIDLLPWLLRPVPGDPYHRKFLMIPVVVQAVLLFSTFLIAARLGCLSPRHPDEFESRRANPGLGR